MLESQQQPPTLHGGNYIEITITDHGVGIPHNIIDKIFDPYFSTKQAGSGLGLAISHSIITRHGGYITVKSEPGEGTTFSIYLAASINQLPDSLYEETSSVTHGNCKIMIMDDDEMVRNMVKAMLTRLGYEVELAADGEEAIRIYKKELAKDTPVDLIIMDLTIPGGMGGGMQLKKFWPSIRMRKSLFPAAIQMIQ